MATKIKGLQMWCRKMTEGYPHVDISNFTTAWRDGMAFCAIIHRFRPDLIDYDSLSPENVFENNKLAFEVGESELNIPAFLEADDMARLKVPDKLSVITYVSQYYNYLNNLPQLGGPGVKGAVKKGHVAGTKRPPDTTKTSSEPSTKKTVSSKEDAKNIANTQTNTTSSPRKGTVGDKCGICQNKVYLLERHIEGGKLYHRSCFRHSDLSPTNKVYTKSPFMSPSLNTEKAVVADKPSKVYGISDKSQTPSNDIHEKHNNNIANSNKKGSESSVLANLKSGLKKVDGGSSAGGMVGSKHSIQVDKDKDDEAKKAKVQPRNLFGAGGGLGKENQNSEKRIGNESIYPLSGKEAKKLEKRRQEILASESLLPVNKGAKRGMPLVFQSKDKAEAISSSPSTQSTTNKPSVGSGDNVNANSSSKTPVSGLKSESKDAKSKPAAPSGVSQASKLNTIQSLQSKFSGQSQPSSNKVESTASPGMKSSTATISNQPVARPRVTGSKIASSPFINGDSSSTGKNGNNSGPSGFANEPVSLRNKSDSQSVNAPIAVPRKSLVENVNSKKVITSDKDKKTSNLSHSHLTTESSSSEDNCTPRSSRSKFSTTSSSSSTASTPPPALPLTPPPSFLSHSKPPSLPQSKPPPLPTSPPPNVPTSTNHHSSNVNNKTKLSSLSPPSSSLTSSSSSSPSTSSTTTTAKISLKPVSPTPTQQPPIQNLVTSSDKKEDGAVLSGLLASLAGVRGRSASTPNPVTPTQQQQPLATTKVNKVQVTGATTPKTTNKLTVTAVSTVATTTITPSTPSLTVLSNRTHSEPAVKLGDVKFRVQHEDKDKKSESSSSPFASKKSIPIFNTTSISSSSTHKESSNSDSNEVKNVLNSLKPVSTTNISTPSKNYTASSIQSSDKSKDMQKTNNAKSENKVGNLLKNYLSKSKEDLSKSEESTHSKVEDSSKKPSKPLRAKDIGIKDQPSSNSNISQGGKDSKGAVGDQSKCKNNDTSTSPRYDVKLKKVGLPTEFEKDSSNNSKSALHLKTEEGDQKNKNDVVSDVPQWKKDIEERKKKLREDIIRSETPSKRSERQDKEKSQPRKDTAPKESVPDLSVKSEKVSSAGKDVVASSKEDNSKLNWQLEAERRMAAFALFDSEEESKSSGGSDAKVEDKITEMNNEQKKRNAEIKSSKLKDGVELTKHNNNVGLKTVDIDIDINGDSGKNRKELSKPQSINNNNNLPLRLDLKKTSEISNPQQTLEMKDKILKKNEGDAKQPVKDTNTTRQQPSPTVSPKLKRKITVLGSNHQKANHQPAVSPPVTPVISEKKKISVIGKFDFDSSTPSDYESSISVSTEQIRIEDQSPIPSSPTPPPRTKSQRNKAASPKQISAIELQQQLMEIDNRLTDLELRGRDLEDSIRNASFQEGSSMGASSNSDDFDDDDDRLMMEWFQLVSEKNELVRKEADLVYLSREQDLEDEQEQIDHQLRYLLNKDDLIKSPQEREEEAYLLQRKVDIVNQRSNIIDSMDEDRLRYEEEDRGIEYVLKSKGLWKDDDGSFLVEQGRSVANSTFYA